jgi:hypothetical protein
MFTGQNSNKMEIETQTKRNRPINIGQYLFIGFMFAGMGIGGLLDNTSAGILIGMAAGFIAMAVTAMIKNKKQNNQ